jgi:hypothetical protein
MSFHVYCSGNVIGGNVACVGEMMNTNILQKTLRKETIGDVWSTIGR